MTNGLNEALDKQNAVTVGHVPDIYDWLRGNCTGRWRCRTADYGEGYTVSFEQEEDAVLFRLKWK